jgi:2-keto-4-pentenoate hydratase/2-oxohepta-3-ene-1,7-dioic acid hydratase in catechol pathway
VHEDRVARIDWKGRVYYAKPEGQDLALLSGSPIDGLVESGVHVTMKEVRFLPPVPATKLIGIGANFPGEAPMGSDPYPSFFVKPPSAFTGHLAVVELPHVFRSVVAEGELGVVIRRRCHNLRPEEVQAVILGWTVVNDLSGRDSTLSVVPPAVKKSADGFAPMGPYLSLDPVIRSFSLTTWRNGEVVQRGSTADLRFGVVECLVHISSIMTLEPYDVVALGTPPPKPSLIPGDEVTVEIDGIGRLVNRIVAREQGESENSTVTVTSEQGTMRGPRIQWST